MKLKLGRDKNGNKILTVSVPGFRGFSIQTMGNMPEAHRMTNSDLNKYKAEQEVHDFVKHYGTKRQKELLGW